MKPLLLFLLLSTAAWGQDSTTTKIFRDVYGNWYDSKGVVETQAVNKPFQRLEWFAESGPIFFGQLLEVTGSQDITINAYASFKQSKTDNHRATLFINGTKQELKVKSEKGMLYVLINNKWVRL